MYLPQPNKEWIFIFHLICFWQILFRQILWTYSPSILPSPAWAHHGPNIIQSFPHLRCYSSLRWKLTPPLGRPLSFISFVFSPLKFHSLPQRDPSPSEIHLLINLTFSESHWPWLFATSARRNWGQMLIALLCRYPQPPPRPTMSLGDTRVHIAPEW